MTTLFGDKPRIYSNIVEGYKRVSSNPGVRTDPVSGTPQTHAGVDIPVAQGTPVKTPADGQIWAAESLSSGYGNYVIVAHPNATNPTSFTMYGHLQSPIALQKGESVTAGTALGFSGNTGKSTGPHLHYEERVVSPSEGVVFSNSDRQNYNQFLQKATFLDPNKNELGFGTWNPSQLDRSHLTPAERISQAKLTDSEFASYKEQLANIETKGKSESDGYVTTSSSGTYLGRYQLGKDSGMVEAGYLDKSGNWTDYAKSKGVSSVNEFLGSPTAQDDALRRLTDKNTEFLIRNDLDLHIGGTVGGTPLTGAGLLLGAHNSRGNLKDYVLSDGQTDKGDGNGFAVSNFVALGDKVQPSAGTASSNPSTPTGHWEYPDDAYYDPMTGIQVGGSAPVWVADAPSPAPPTTRDHAATPAVVPKDPSATAPPPTPQISPDGTTALLPNGQVIRAGTGGTVDIDANGNLVVSRPAQGWTNADGSPSDIRQITTYDAKGAQLGTTIAQNLPGEAAPVENYAQRTVQVHNPDGSTLDVNTHFQAGVGWVDDAGKTVLSLKDAQVQLDAKNAHLIPGASADNDYTPGGPTGEAEARDYMGKTPAQQANPDSGGGSDAEPDPQSSQGHGGSDTPSDFHTALLDAFTNPTLPNIVGPATQYAALNTPNTASDAGPGLPDIATAPSPAPNPNSYTAYLQSQGTALTPKQQDALASQIDQLKLGSSDDLSFYRLPDGSTLIANADGDLVGELGAPRNGEISLRANAIAEDGSATTHERYITTDGQATSYSPQALAQVNAGLSLVQGLDGLQHWDKMSDSARLGSLVGLASSINTLSDGALGNLGNLGTAASALGLMQALQDGNTAGVVSGINAVSGGAIDGALNSAVNSALGTASSSVPYVSIALALNDFEKHVGSSLGTLVGTFFFGGPIGGAIGGMVGGMFDSMFGGSHSPPPPPEGAVHFGWDAAGHIQHTIYLDERGGGSAANQVAAGVQGLLEQVVRAANANHTDPNQDLAINPYLLPRFGVSEGATWMEVTQSDGSTLREDISQEGFAEHLIAILQDNGALAPAWQVATVQGHWAQAQEELADLRAQHATAVQGENSQAGQIQQQIDTRQQALDHELHIGNGGHAYAGNEAYSLQGNAAESTDFKTQDFGVLVVHVSKHSGVQASAQALGQTLEHIQKQALELSETLRDVENDGYAERTEWVSATDSAGNLQGLLVLDQNGNGLIETRDILNIGGNTGQTDNATPEAKLASQNAALQHNNVQWLDANGDGVLDARDPAFAAIKLWVDMNQDGQMQASEGATFADMGLQSINFKTGEVVYADGGRAPLSAATLHADTDGVRMTQITEVNPDGTLHVLDAGQVLEHEGYQGQVQITDGAGTRWSQVREQTYEQDAKRIGDWEGTAEQEAHRHYGQNAADAATETTATGAISMGPVEAVPNATSVSTVSLGDSRVSSDAAAAAAPKPNAQAVIAAGDIRIKSDAPAPAAPKPSANSAASQRLAFVPSAPQSGQNEIRIATDAMVQSAQDTVFGPGLGLLAVVGLGATAGAAEAAQVAQRQMARGDSPALGVQTSTLAISTDARFVSLDNPAPSAPAKPTFVQASVLSASTPPATTAAPPMHTPVAAPAEPLAIRPVSSANALLFVEATVVSAGSYRETAAPAFATPATQAAAPALSASGPLVLLPPVLVEQTITSAEDTPLRLGSSALLASAQSPNAVSNPDSPMLTITGVANAAHGRVQLVGSDVFFVPDANFHGTANFSYTVTDQYGLSSTTTAKIQVAAVNDAPVGVGESTLIDEDVGLVFTAASLLANDSDVDTATDDQTLSISKVTAATHGTAWLDNDGNVRFMPDANYHGPASFNYTVSDGNGGTATTTVKITVAAVNDAPVAVGESSSALEDTTLTIAATKLLSNDSDVDTATDGQVLTISSVSNPSHGTVRLVTLQDGSQQVAFTPDANFHGAASFEYAVSDGNGGTATAIAIVNVAAVNDAPVAVGESATTDEDVGVVFTAASLLANDSDVDTATDGQTLSISKVSGATNGTAWLDTDGSIRFVPDANHHGPASFSYTVSDGNGGTASTTVNIIVAAVNDAPVAVSESSSTPEDATLYVDATTLLLNDSDVDTATDGQTLSISAVSNPSHGTVRLVTLQDGGRQVAFTPDANFHGTASFQYTVSDGNGGTATATAIVNVGAVNDAPVAVGESATTDEDVGLVFTAASLLANDSDVDTATDGQSLIISKVTAATNGTVWLDADGNVRFVLDANYHGPASFSYTVSDGIGGTTTATVNITVAAVNDAPVAVGESSSTLEDTPLYIAAATLLSNDSDVDTATDGQTLTIGAVSNPSHGSVCLVTLQDGSRQVAFTPDTNFHGAASFQYTVNDGNGGTVTAIAIVNVAAVNDAPLALGDLLALQEDATLQISTAQLLANDQDNDIAADGDVLRITRVFDAQHCTVVLNADYTISLRPDADYHGTVRFSYEAVDLSGATSVAQVVAGINAVNDAPVAYADQAQTVEDQALLLDAIALLANDTDNDVATDGDSLSVASLANAVHGTVRLTADGQIEFVPDANFHGEASFDYVVIDSFGATSTATVTVAVAAANDAPVVLGERAAANEDTLFETTAAALLANDSDADATTDGQTLAVVQVDNAQNGVVVMDANGKITFIPSANVHGTASFDYLVSDGAGGLTTGTMQLQLAAVNDAPVALGESATTDEDVGLVFTVASLLANDTDVDLVTDGQTLSISAVSNASHGTVRLVTLQDGSQQVAFTPDANFHGAASFQYTASDGNGGTATATAIVNVAAVNDVPVVVGESATTDEDVGLVFTAASLLANDSDVDAATDGQTLSISAVNSATNGTAWLDTEGSIRFLPDTDHHGPASFSYTVSDGNGGTATATVNITVAAVNDAPVAQGESASTLEDTTLTIAAATLLTNDSDVDMATDGQTLSISAVSNASHGTVRLVTLQDGSQQVAFTPDANFHGAASFKYTVSDGNGGTATASAIVNVAAVNDAPVALGESGSTLEDTILTIATTTLLANDSDVDSATDGQTLIISSVSNPSHGAVRLVTYSDGSQQVEFTPDTNFHGAASFHYTVSDGKGGTATATATVNVAAVNDAPVAVGESDTTNEDLGLVFAAAQLLANDSDVDTATDGQTLSISKVSGATNGTAWLDTDGNIRFVPDADYHGPASFSYTVSDGNGGTVTATVNITVAAVNDAPVTVGDSVSTPEDNVLCIDAATLLANDSDADTTTDRQTLTISAVSNPSHGTVRLVTLQDGSQQVAFTPDANFHGTASFQYTVSDGNGGTATATAIVNVAVVNDVPVVIGESATADEDLGLIFTAASLLANDSDADSATDGQVLTISAVSNPSQGTVRLVTLQDGSQHVAFTPDANFHGAASFQYTVSDGNGGAATATAIINYSAVNDAPVAVGESAQGNEDQRLVFTSSELLANDSDVDTATDGQTLSISHVGDAAHGTVTLDAQGNIYFTPDANYHGAASFSYWVSDGTTETPATVRLTIAPVNDLPVAQGETVNSDEDAVLLLDPATLLANDGDVDVTTDGQTLSISALGSASHCSVAFMTQADGSQRIRFTPEANYFGTASFQYTVSDGNGVTATAAVVVNLAQVNDVPVARDDSLDAIDEDTALHISFATLLANDTDADSANAALGGTFDAFTVVSVGEASHGTATLTATDVLFTPDANYNGPANFTYQVRDSGGAIAQAYTSFTVRAVNDAPVALGETISINEDTSLVIQPASLLANDSDVDTATDGQVLSISAVGNATHGNVSINADGNIVFIPDANYVGSASFVYTVSDGNGGLVDATATIVLAAVNDAPVGLGETIQSTEDQVLKIDAATLLANDSDVDNVHADLSLSRVQSGTGGTVALNAAGQVVFTPEATFNGNATFTYWARDPVGLESGAVTATVVLAAVNDAPTVQGEIVTGALEDAVFRIAKATLLANDQDMDDLDSALRLSWVGSASGGSASLDSNGDVVFTPGANFNGNASFQYKVRDAAGLESAVVTAIFPVAAVNDAPMAVDDQFSTYRGSTMAIGFGQLTSNDSDVDGDALTVSAVRDRANGHTSIVNGYVQFVPDAGFSDGASFDYLADDGHGGQTWATAFVDVRVPPNLYPIIDAGSLSVSPSWYNSEYVELWSLSVGFHITDEDAGSVSMRLASATAYAGQGALYPVATTVSFARNGDGGSMSFSAYYSQLIWVKDSQKLVESPLWFNELRSTWVLTDNTGVQNVWHFDFHDDGYPGNWHVESYADHSGYYTSPVLLDLNGDGVHFTALQDSHVAIDANHDGVKDKMAWAGHDDGVLVWDKDQNQQVSDVSEFGFQHLKAGAQTDLEGLQALDTNHNGLLDTGDDTFAEFALWQDANGNGMVDEGEFLTLQERGIASINLHSDGQMRDAGTLVEGSLTGETDATVMGNAAYTRTDGSTGLVADAMLAYSPGQASVAAADTTGAAQETASAKLSVAAAPNSAATANLVVLAGPESVQAFPTADAPAAPALAQTASLLSEAEACPAAAALSAPLPQGAPSTEAADGTVIEHAAVAVDVEAAGAAELARQAALFNQFCNSDVVDVFEPLGFVTLEQTLQLIDLQVMSQDDAYHRPQAA